MGKGWHIITEADIKKYENNFEVKEKVKEKKVVTKTATAVKQVYFDNLTYKLFTR
jgi:hypothetical protein